MPKLTVTYAGLPFATDLKPELADRFARYMPAWSLPDVVQPFADWPGPNLLGLGMPMPPAPPMDVSLGRLWYPWGMSRCAVYRGVMTAANVTSLGATVEADPTAAQTFRVVCDDVTMDTTMHVLPPRPCAEDGLYLVTLVDDRFHRWHRSSGKVRPDGTLTWASLITALASALGITLTSAAVDAAYYKPEPDSPLYSSDESAAVMLDAAAANVGRVVVRNLDGTYKLETYAAGNTAAGTSRNDSGGNRLARLWGGTILPTDPTAASSYRPQVVPASVVVTFPKWVTGSGYYEPSTYRQYRKDSYGDVYEKTVALADCGSPYSALTAGPGKKVIRVTAKAKFATAADASAGTPRTNDTDLDALAIRQAKDFYDGQAAALDEIYRGFVKRTPDGATDVIWSLRPGDIFTRAVRRPWDYGHAERQIAIEGLTIPAAAPPGQPRLAVYAIADLGGNQYTVRAVHRDGSGNLVDDTGPTNYTAYEAQSRAVWIDTPGSPTREYPLCVDSAGAYYFQIDQYTAGELSPPLAGLVSTTTQSIKGVKTFINTAYFLDDISVTDAITVSASDVSTVQGNGAPSVYGFLIASGTPVNDGFGTPWTSWYFGGDVLAFGTGVNGLPVYAPYFVNRVGGYAIGHQPFYGSPPTTGDLLGQWGGLYSYNPADGSLAIGDFAGGILVGWRSVTTGGGGGGGGGGTPGPIRTPVPGIGGGPTFGGGPVLGGITADVPPPVH